MNYQCPFRRGLPHLQYACAFAMVCASLLFVVSRASAQDVAEAARQEKARKAAQSQKQPHVYTNEDLQRSQILTPEDRGTVEARKKKSEHPGVNESSPSNAGVEDAAAPESIGEIARRLRREKARREAERAGKVRPPSPFKMELPQQPTLAHPELLSGPLVVPSPAASKTIRPSVATGTMKRDPFSRAAISPASQNSISAPAPRTVAPRATLPLAAPAVASPTPVLPIAPYSRVESKDRTGSVRIQAGDSLWNLSRQYLGKGSRWQEWFSRNPQLGDPRRLQPGTTLVVPDAKLPSQSRSNPRAGLPAEVVTSGTVSVKSGDSLWKITAQHFGNGANWPCLAHANPDLRDVDVIFPGQILTIPNACSATQPSSLSSNAPASPPAN
jgi:nucleoid-associated protein YgaU